MQFKYYDRTEFSFWREFILHERCLDILLVILESTKIFTKDKLVILFLKRSSCVLSFFDWLLFIFLTCTWCFRNAQQECETGLCKRQIRGKPRLFDESLIHDSHRWMENKAYMNTYCKVDLGSLKPNDKPLQTI